MSNEDDWYYIRVLEPVSGQIRTVFLYNEISAEELSILLCAAFSESVFIDKIIGLRDEETSTFYPLSILDRSDSYIASTYLNRRYYSVVTSLSSYLYSTTQSVADTTSYCTENTEFFSDKTVYDKSDLEDDLSYQMSLSQSSVSEDVVITAFNLLDENKDGKVHKEEFISVLTTIYDQFFTDDNNKTDIDQSLIDRRKALNFAYSCMSSKDLAVVTAVKCYKTITPLNPSATKTSSTPTSQYYMTCDDLYAWYFFSGVEPLRDIMICAIHFFFASPPTNERSKVSWDDAASMETTTSSNNGGVRTLQRNKSVTNLLDSKKSSDSLESFIQKCHSKLRLQVAGTVSYLINLLLISSVNSSSGSSWLSNNRSIITISKEKFRDMFVSFLSFKGSIRAFATSDKYDDPKNGGKDLLYLTNTIFSIATSQYNTFTSSTSSHQSNEGSICHVQCMQEEAAVGDLISLLSILGDNDRNYLQNYQSVFDAYKQHGEELVDDVILFNHLHQVFRTIFYFNSTVRANACCPPEDLAHAISIKFLSLTEVERREKDKLSFDEFIELITQCIKLGLQMLGMKSGFFFNTLAALVGFRVLQQDTLNSESNHSMSTNSSPLRRHRSLSIEGSNDNAAYLTTTSSSTDYDDDYDYDTEDLQPEDMLEDSQVVSLFIEYCGDVVNLSDAKDVLGLSGHSPQNALWFIRSFSDNENALLSQTTYQKGLLKLVGPRYVSLSVLQRSVADFVIDRLFSVYDPSKSGYCSSRDICCALTLFCGGSGHERAKAAYSILVLNNNRQETPSPEKVHLLTAVQCVSALLKANCCLDPSAKVFDFAQADHLAVQATLQYVFNLSDSPIKTSIEDSQLFPQEDFISLFSSIISQLEVGDKQEEKYNLKVQSPVRRTNNIQFSYQFSEFGEPTENGQHNSDNDQDSNKNSRSSSRDFSGTNDAVYFSDESSWNNNSDRISLDIDAMKAESSDGGDDNDAESIISAVDPQKDSVYRNDKAYPPSASVLELRAAQSVLGLENYKVCKLMDSLAGKSEEGVIKLGPWLSWLFDAMLLANVSKQDIKIASSLGTKLFEVFQRDSSDSATSTPSNTSDSSHPVAEREVLFSTFTAGLAFLCGGSPTEDKLMVAFTLVDSDSDGFITQNEFKELVTAALKTVTVCSKLVQAKVLHLSTDVRELADMVVNEAMSSLNLKEDDELSLEMVCELAEDFLKLAALY